MANPTTWVITASGDRPIHDVATDLQAAGLTDCQILEEIGVITGCADGSALSALKTVVGVSDVAAETVVDIGPPGAKIS